MAKQNINVGTAANDKKGDSLRAAFVKVNANFTELYTELGLVVDANLNLGAFEFAGSTISTTDSSAIVIDQATTITSNLSVGGDLLPQTANGGDLGSSTLPWRSLYVSNNTIFIGGVALGVDSQGNLLVGGQSIADVGTAAWNSITGKPTFATVATSGAYADLTDKPTLFDGAYSSLSGQPALFSGSYADLTNKPNLAGTYQFSVAADDSTQRVISTDEVIKFIGAGGITTASDAEGNITINYVQGDIRSEGNINIDINLADSTLRRWQFGEDGNLTLPQGGNISEGGGISGAIRLTPSGGANAYQALLIYPTGFAEGDHLHLTAGGGTTELYLGNDLHYVKLANDGFVIIKADDGVNSAVWGFSPDGTTSIPGDIKSDSNINIEINLSDSTLRRWQFGEDGNLTLPQGGNISEGGGISGAIRLTPAGGANAYQALLIYPTAGEGDHIHLTAGGGSTELYLGNDLHYVKLESDGNIRIQADNGVNGAAWTFGTDGSLQIPGDIRSEGNINIDINLSDSTLRRWQFGEDGELTFPDGTTTTGKGITLPVNQSLTVNLPWEGGFGTGTTTFKINTESIKLPTGNGYIYSGGETNAERWGLDAANKTLFFPDAGDGVFPQIKYSTTGNDGMQLFTAAKPIKITVEPNNWTFGTDGALTIPGNIVFSDTTIQTTAWTGSIGTQATLNVTGAITAESFNTDQITIVGNRISTTVTNANLEIEGNGVGRVVINAIEDATTDSTTRSVGYLGLPPANSSITRTLTIADSGKHTYITAAGVTLTIPAASSVAYPVGTTLTFIAGPSSTSVAIAITTDTMYLAGTGTTGTRTLAAHGMATAVKVSGTSSAGVWYINGTGLT